MKCKALLISLLSSFLVILFSCEKESSSSKESNIYRNLEKWSEIVNKWNPIVIHDSLDFEYTYQLQEKLADSGQVYCFDDYFFRLKDISKKGNFYILHFSSSSLGDPYVYLELKATVPQINILQNQNSLYAGRGKLIFKLHEIGTIRVKLDIKTESIPDEEGYYSGFDIETFVFESPQSVFVSGEYIEFIRNDF